ncbi:DUF7660 family protein [Streptomyces sp. SYSU K217416]
MTTEPTPLPEAAVDSREALAAHILQLRSDLLERPEEWENATLESLLEALAAWINSSPGLYRNLSREFPPGGSWSLFAHALSAAAIYE